MKGRHGGFVANGTGTRGEMPVNRTLQLCVVHCILSLSTEAEQRTVPNSAEES
jgi:hypothetical protein